MTERTITADYPKCPVCCSPDFDVPQLIPNYLHFLRTTCPMPIGVRAKCKNCGALFDIEPITEFKSTEI